MYFLININHIGLFTFELKTQSQPHGDLFICMRSNCAYDPMDDGEVTARQSEISTFEEQLNVHY